MLIEFGALILVVPVSLNEDKDVFVEMWNLSRNGSFLVQSFYKETGCLRSLDFGRRSYL